MLSPRAKLFIHTNILFFSYTLIDFIQILYRFCTDFIPQKLHFLGYKTYFSELYKIPILSILVSNWFTYNRSVTSRKSV